MAVTVVTSFTGRDLAGALALARGLKAHHPDWKLWGVVADRLADAPSGFDRTFGARELFGQGWPAFAFRHEADDIGAAVRGRALRAALETEAGAVFCISPDIAVFADLGDLARRLETASILLIPRQAEPNASARAAADNEARALRRGVFNPNLVGVRNDAAGAAFARWWSERLDGACYDAAGLFDDGKYFDLVPALFDGVAVCREAGAGVASWNLSRRELGFGEDGRLLVNGAGPLLAYDFSNPYGDGGIMTERYAGRNLAVYELLAWRRRALAMAPASEWAFDRFEDGAAVSSAARRFYRADPELAARYPEPFAAGEGSYLAWVRANRTDLL